MKEILGMGKLLAFFKQKNP